MRFTLVVLLLVTSAPKSTRGQSTSKNDAAKAKALFLAWVSHSGIPGDYTTAAQRREKDTHPGDLVGTPIFSSGKHGAFDFENGNGQWSHTKPNQIFTDSPSESALLTCPYFSSYPFLLSNSIYTGDISRGTLTRCFSLPCN